jgi:hypothetical protein
VKSFIIWGTKLCDADILLGVFYSTMKMEAKYSSETSVDFQQTTWSYIPEDKALQHPARGVTMYRTKQIRGTDSN